MPKREEKKGETKYSAITFTMSDGSSVAYRVTEEQVETVLEVLGEDPAIVLIGENKALLRLNADHLLAVRVDPEYPDVADLMALAEVY